MNKFNEIIKRNSSYSDEPVRFDLYKLRSGLIDRIIKVLEDLLNGKIKYTINFHEDMGNWEFDTEDPHVWESFNALLEVMIKDFKEDKRRVNFKINFKSFDSDVYDGAVFIAFESLKYKARFNCNTDKNACGFLVTEARGKRWDTLHTTHHVYVYSADFDGNNNVKKMCDFYRKHAVENDLHIGKAKSVPVDRYFIHRKL